MMGPWWISANPNAMVVPKDKNLALTFHSYSPWGFAGDKPTITEYTDAMAAKEALNHKQMHAWAESKGIRAVVVDEFGTTHFQTNRAAVLKYFAANSEAAIKNGNGYAVWDDNGWYQILNRTSKVWDEDVVRSLKSFSPSPKPPSPSPK